MSKELENSVKIVLSVLFLLCLLKMPYGFYQLVRFLGMIGFGVLAYHSYKKQKHIEMLIYVSLAILFQPLIKISLGRIFWNIIDVIVSIGLLWSILINKNK